MTKTELELHELVKRMMIQETETDNEILLLNQTNEFLNKEVRKYKIKCKSLDDILTEVLQENRAYKKASDRRLANDFKTISK